MQKQRENLMGNDEMTASHVVRRPDEPSDDVLFTFFGAGLCPAASLGASQSGLGVLRQERWQERMRKGPRGVYGVCRFPDGRVVEEWTYFHEMKGKSGVAR